MVNIIIYTTTEILKQKQKLIDCYWSLSNKPKKELKPYESEIYFATNKFIQGKFLITEVSDQDIFFEGWIPLKNPVPQKSFQGFKYLEDRLN